MKGSAATIRRVVLAVVLTAAAAVPLSAQGKWHELYDKGVKAFNAKNFPQAVTLLEQAVAVDPKDGGGKIIEGTFRMDYFPYFYLGAAYVELKQYDKAERMLTRAKATLPRSLQARHGDYSKRLTTETAVAKAPPPPSLPPVTTPPPVVVTPPPVREAPVRPPPNPAFDAAMRAADAALGSRNYSEAVSSFETARRADASAFSQQNGQARLDEATRGVTGQRLAAEAHTLLERADLNAAEARFEQANASLPGQRAVLDGLATIRQRRETYQRLKNEAEQSIQSNTFQAAQLKLEQARSADPHQFNTDRLEARLRFVADRLAQPPVVPPKPPGPDRAADDAAKALQAAQAQTNLRFGQLRAEAAEFAARGNAPAATDRLNEARRLDPKRFDDEKLSTLLDRLVEDRTIDRDKPLDREKTAFRNGLVALMRGDAQGAVGILESALASAPGNSPQAAGLRAYLGVAYATQALTSPVESDSTKQLQEKARAQFKLALRAQESYQLSTRIVSPKILDLFDQARRGK